MVLLCGDVTWRGEGGPQYNRGVYIAAYVWCVYNLYICLRSLFLQTSESVDGSLDNERDQSRRKCLYIEQSRHKCLYIEQSRHKCLYIEQSRRKCLYRERSRRKCLYIEQSRRKCLYIRRKCLHIKSL